MPAQDPAAIVVTLLICLTVGAALFARARSGYLTSSHCGADVEVGLERCPACGCSILR